MATALKLRSDIKKLKKGLEAKGVSASVKEKLKSQLQKAENELASLKKTGKAPKKSSVAGTKVALTALQKLIQKKKYGVYQGAGVDLKKDAGEGALATGRRESKGLKSNQYGDKSDNKGNVYYEYRPNRLDVKQPKKRQSYPKLEDGGMMAKGGKLEAGVYRVGKPNKVSPILYEQKIVEIFENGDIATASDYGRKLTDFKVQSYPIITTEQLEAQYKMEKGGYMAKGGVIYLKSVGTYLKPSDMTTSPEKEFKNEGEINYVYENTDEWWESLSNSDKKIIESFKNNDGGMMAEGGIAEGYHQMPDGSIMADSAHMARGGETKNYKDNVKEELENLNEEISSIDKYLKKLENENSEDAYKASNNLRQYKSSLEAKKLHLEDNLKEKGGYMADGGEVKVGDILTASTGVKVKVVEYDPKFGGRVRVERMDEYATGKPSQYMPLSKFKMASGGYMAKGGTTSKFEVDDVVYNKRTKTVGIVRMEDEKGETKTDADGNVNTSELQHYNPMKYSNQKDAKVAPSTSKEIDQRGLWQPFKPKEMGGMMAEGGEVEVGDKVKYKNAKYHATVIEVIDDAEIPYAKIEYSDGRIAKAYLEDLQKVKLAMAKEYVNPNYMAEGGALEHGLKVGDVVKLVSGNMIAVYNTGDKNSYRIDISKGERKISDLNFNKYAHGGHVMSTTHRMSN